VTYARVRVYAYMYMQAFIQTYIHTCYIHTYLFTYCIHTHTHKYICAGTYTHTFCIYAHTHKYICAGTYLQMHQYIHIFSSSPVLFFDPRLTTGVQLRLILSNQGALRPQVNDRGAVTMKTDVSSPIYALAVDTFKNMLEDIKAENAQEGHVGPLNDLTWSQVYS
jgi:hypothetical protein